MHEATAGARAGLTDPVPVDPTGSRGPTPGRARGPGWRRTSLGLYVPVGVGLDRPEQRILEAARAAGTAGTVTGWASLRWRSGSRWLAGVDVDGRPAPVPVLTRTHGARPLGGVLLSEERVDRADVEVVDGVEITSATAALSWQVRHSTSLREAVTWIDMAAHADLVSLEEQRALVERQSGWTGVPRHREALDLADENSWSPAETRMRLAWVLDAGLPRPRCNAPVFDRDGRHLATSDLVDGDVGLVCEYDGSDHLDGRRRLADVRREDLLVSHGLEYVTTLAGDTQGSASFVQRLRRRWQEARGRRLHEAGRAWTLDPPTWWTDTSTVQARRALDDHQRARLLRYRAA